jgi:Uma2 family endonuclease
VWLVVEMARTSQQLDRKKAAIHGAAGIPVYWLIDLGKAQVELFSDPTAAGYAQQTALRSGESIALPRSTVL